MAHVIDVIEIAHTFCGCKIDHIDHISGFAASGRGEKCDRGAITPDHINYTQMF